MTGAAARDSQDGADDRHKDVGVPDDPDTTIVLTALLEALDTGSRRVPSEATDGRRAHGLATLLANTLGDGAEVLSPLPAALDRRTDEGARHAVKIDVRFDDRVVQRRLAQLREAGSDLSPAMREIM